MSGTTRNLQLAVAGTLCTLLVAGCASRGGGVSADHGAGRPLPVPETLTANTSHVRRGAAAAPSIPHRSDAPPTDATLVELSAPEVSSPSDMSDHVLVSAQSEDEAAEGVYPVPPAAGADGLDELVRLAWENNPSLSRFAREAEAAWDRTRIVGALPDPMLGANVFAQPIETAAGSQRANMSLSQMLPWLERLSAREQQAVYEAMAMDQMLKAAQLKVEVDVKTAYFRLYEIRREANILDANRQLLEAILQIAVARVAQGAPPGDVLRTNVELSKLEERRLALRQTETAVTAELNRLLNRPADTPVHVPDALPVPLAAWPYEMLVEQTLTHQPEIEVARLRTHATTWGIEVACLQRRPDVQLNLSWFAIDDNRPPSSVVDVGRDAWSVGASVSIPLWQRKYDAIESEAVRKHQAARADVDDVTRKYQSKLFDLLDRAQTARRTIELYQDTILPQARQTLAADQEAYAQSQVEIDRVIQDLKSVLEFEISYHKSVSALAISVALLEQATGSDLNAVADN